MLLKGHSAERFGENVGRVVGSRHMPKINSTTVHLLRDSIEVEREVFGRRSKTSALEHTVSHLAVGLEQHGVLVEPKVPHDDPEVVDLANRGGDGVELGGARRVVNLALPLALGVDGVAESLDDDSRR